MANNNERKFVQVTSVEHLGSNEAFFNSLMEKIKMGESIYAVERLKQLPKSNRDIVFSYKDIMAMAVDFDETVVYDDFNYILSANDDVMVLYKSE